MLKKYFLVFAISFIALPNFAFTIHITKADPGCYQMQTNGPDAGTYQSLGKDVCSGKPAAPSGSPADPTKFCYVEGVDSNNNVNWTIKDCGNVGQTGITSTQAGGSTGGGSSSGSGSGGSSSSGSGSSTSTDTSASTTNACANDTSACSTCGQQPTGTGFDSSATGSNCISSACANDTKATVATNLCGNSCTPGYDPTTGCGIVKRYIDPLINVLAAGIGIVVTIMIIVGGIQYSSAGGDPQKVAAAKKRIFNAIFALVSFGLLYAALNFFLPGGLGL